MDRLDSPPALVPSPDSKTRLAGLVQEAVRHVFPDAEDVVVELDRPKNAALGDAIATMLEWQGWRVTREFYYNDGGNQIANLALSVQARIKQARGEAMEMPKDGYLGDYIREIAKEYVAAHFGDAAGNDL